MIANDLRELYQQRLSVERTKNVDALSAKLKEIDDSCAKAGVFRSGLRLVKLADAIAEANAELLSAAWLALREIIESGGVPYTENLGADLKSCVGTARPRDARFRALQSHLADTRPGDTEHLRGSLEKRLRSAEADVNTQIDLFVMTMRTEASTPWHARPNMRTTITGGVFILVGAILGSAANHLLDLPWEAASREVRGDHESEAVVSAPPIISVSGLGDVPEESPVTFDETARTLTDDNVSELQEVGFIETNTGKVVTWSGVLQAAKDRDADGRWIEARVRAPQAPLDTKFVWGGWPTARVYFPADQRSDLMRVGVGDTVRFKGLLVLHEGQRSIEVHDACLLGE